MNKQHKHNELIESIQEFVNLILAILSIIARPVLMSIFLLGACYGLYWAVKGSTYTNYISLLTKFQFADLAYGISLAITLGFTIAQFFIKKNYITRFTIGAIMFFSSALAINMFATKEISDAEDRLRNDREYIMWEKEYNTKMQSYNDFTKTVNEQTDKDWETGAREARYQRDQVKKEADKAFTMMRSRADTLKIKGTVVNEAFVDTWYTLAHDYKLPFIRNISTKGISVSSTLLFSLINDTIILIFCAVIRMILGQTIFIPEERKFTQPGIIKVGVDRLFGGLFGNSRKRLVNAGERSLIVHQDSPIVHHGSPGFSKQNDKDQRRQGISDETFTGIEAILKVNRKYVGKQTKKTYEEIGSEAARLVNRSKPFSKGYVCKIIKNWVS